MKRVVVIGGGHGLSIILSGIKNIKDIDIKAIVTVADSGGSTGRIRQFYNIPAMGDIRNVLVALSDIDDPLVEMMDYRFKGENEEDIIGHNLGNLMLTALTDITGNFVEAVDLFTNMLNIKAKIIPSTSEPVNLYALMDDGTMVMGEANIPSLSHHIDKVFYDHKVKAQKAAVRAIMNADVVIYGLGSLYTSILPNIIVPDIKEALHKTKAKRVYLANCMTQSNETFDYDLKDHVDALINHGAVVDLIIKHQEEIPAYILERYAANNASEIVYNNDIDIEVRSRDLLDFSYDQAKHDPEKIKKCISELLEEL